MLQLALPYMPGNSDTPKRDRRGRPSRKEQGLVPLQKITTKVEPKVVEGCVANHGSLAAALRFAAEHLPVKQAS